MIAVARITAGTITDPSDVRIGCYIICFYIVARTHTGQHSLNIA